MMILNKKYFMIYMINRGWAITIHTEFNFEHIMANETFDDKKL